MSRLPALALMAHDVGGGAACESAAQAGLSTPASLLVETIEAFRSRGYRFVKLGDFVTGRDAGGVALLTFDDGYASLGTRALPALRELGVPALCFLATECLDGHDCFPLWLFALRDAFLAAPHEARIRVESNDVLRDALDRIGARSLGEVFDRPATKLYTTFYPRLSYRSLDRLRGALQELGMAKRLTLDREAVLALQESGLFEFGAHSIAHRNLIQVPPTEAKRQVAESLRSVAGLTGRDVREVAFAYPYGAVCPAARRAVEAVGRVGFTVAERPVLRRDPLALLPRLSLDATVLQRAVQTTSWTALIRERLRIEAAPLHERARQLRNRLRRARPLGAPR